ncbi:hypothetical protein vseg_009020 [Gypsophila vaccaria]
MGRAPCCDRDGLKKGPWLPEEDQKLVDYIQEHGPGNWRTLPKKAGLQRCGKSCRLRWANYLRPDIKRGRFTFEEEEAIIQLHSVLGNKWSAIAAKLPGRTDNEIKNYWNTHIRKRLLRMGIDPVTHTRQLDLLNLHSILNNPLQNSSQFNLLNLLSLQSLVNPDLLRLAALLSSTQTQTQNQDPTFILQNLQANQIVENSNMIQDQYNQNETTFQTNNVLPNLTQPTVDDKDTTTIYHLNQQNIGRQTTDVQQQNGPYNSNPSQVIADFLMNTPDFQSSDSNGHMSKYSSVFSTPSTSQETPMNSNSEHPNSSSNTTSEDEIDSYCQQLLNFDIPLNFFDI